jgi:hypothetical protein
MTDQANSAYMGTPEKLTMAMLQGLNKLPEGIQKDFRAQLQSLKNPQTQAVLGSVAATWGALHLVGVGEAADLSLLGLGYAALGNDAVTATRELASFVKATNEAQVPQNLDRATQQQKLAEASKHFEKFVEIIGVDGIALLVGAKAGEVSTKLANSLKENTAQLSQLPTEAGRLLNAAQEQLSGLTRGLRESAESGWNKLGESLDRVTGRRSITPEGVEIGPLRMEGRGAGGSSSAWVDRAVERIKTQYDGQSPKIAKNVEESLESLKSKLGAAGANNAAQKLEELGTKTLPGLKQELTTLSRHIQELPESQRSTLQNLDIRINKSLNAIENNLKPDEFVGALRDRLDDPVSRWRPGQAPKIYDHNDEVSNGLDSLNETAEKLGLSVNRAPEALKGELSTLSEHINKVIERVEKFRDPATYNRQALSEQSNPTVVAQQTTEQAPSNPADMSQEQLMTRLQDANKVTQELTGRTERNSQNLQEVLARLNKITAERTPAYADAYPKTWSQERVGSAHVLTKTFLNEQEQTAIVLASAKKWLDRSGQQDASGRTVVFSKDYAAARDGQTTTLYGKDTYLPVASYDRSSQILTLERPLDGSDRGLVEWAQQKLLAEQQKQVQVTAQPIQQQREIGGYGDS